MCTFQISSAHQEFIGDFATSEFKSLFKKQQIPIALASSSPLGIIQSVVDTLKIEKYFNVYL